MSTPAANSESSSVSQGVKGFYRGLKASMLGAIPYEGFKFGFFAFFKPYRPAAIENNTVWNMVCGALAGALGSTIMYPNDTIRRILQVQGSVAEKGYLSASNKPKQPYSGMVQCYRDTYQRFGLKRFYRGLGITPGPLIQEDSPQLTSLTHRCKSYSHHTEHEHTVCNLRVRKEYSLRYE